MDWQRTSVTVAMSGVFFATIRTEPPFRDAGMIAKLTGQIDGALSILEAHLADRDFVVGKNLTMADLPLGALAYRYFNMPIERPSLPNIEAWYSRLQERSAYQAHIMNPFGRNPGEWYMLERGIEN